MVWLFFCRYASERQMLFLSGISKGWLREGRLYVVNSYATPVFSSYKCLFLFSFINSTKFKVKLRICPFIRNLTTTNFPLFLATAKCFRYPFKLPKGFTKHLYRKNATILPSSRSIYLALENAFIFLPLLAKKKSSEFFFQLTMGMYVWKCSKCENRVQLNT